MSPNGKGPSSMAPNNKLVNNMAPNNPLVNSMAPNNKGRKNGMAQSLHHPTLYVGMLFALSVIKNLP